MKLVGMLDSPYVRRVAVCLDLLEVPFEHVALSVFSTFTQFQQINPVVKAPTLVCDDGGLLMDSALILQYVEDARGSPSPLWSRDAATRLLQFRAVAHASAACDKVVQLVYEMQLRPPEAQHEPWKKRVRGQLRAAFQALEAMTPGISTGVDPAQLNHATIWSAIVWQCARSLLAGEIPAHLHPKLDRLSLQFETLPVFRRYPPEGPGVPSPA